MEENQKTTEVNNEEVGNAVTQTETKTEEAVKTFTQDEVNSMIRKEKQKLEKKFEGVDITKYKEWVESQKTEEQKQAEREAEYLKKDTKISDLEKENAILKAGVKEDIDYVLFKVSRMEGEFSENLAKFLKDNPKYISSEKIKTVGTSAKLDGTARTGNTTNQIMNDLIRSSRD